jgi:hypothetical protein
MVMHEGEIAEEINRMDFQLMPGSNVLRHPMTWKLAAKVRIKKISSMGGLTTGIFSSGNVLFLLTAPVLNRTTAGPWTLPPVLYQSILQIKTALHCIHV